MINYLLFMWTANLPCRLIYVADKPYLERYYLGMVLGWTFYLHRFVSADAERTVHNHPWWHSFSIILSGWYLEDVVTDLCPQLDDGVVLHRRRIAWFNFIRGSTFHRIAELRPGTWTLFFHGARAVVGEEQKWVRGVKVREPVLKGWGFLEVEQRSTSRVTTFKPFPPSYKLDWWTDAALGRDATREPL